MNVWVFNTDSVQEDLQRCLQMFQQLHSVTHLCAAHVSEHDLDNRKGFYLGYFLLMETAINPI